MKKLRKEQRVIYMFGLLNTGMILKRRFGNDYPLDLVVEDLYKSIMARFLLAYKNSITRLLFKSKRS